MLFRDHQLADQEAYCEMESDREYRFPSSRSPASGTGAGFSRSLAATKADGAIGNGSQSHGFLYWSVRHLSMPGSDDQIIAGAARLAYYLARPYWGQGLATEASRAFVDYGFRDLDLSRIEAGVNANNVASIRVLQKLGFKWILSGEGDGNTWHRFELRNPHRP